METFSARETEWMLELDGIALAGFWRRAIAFGIDSILVLMLTVVAIAAITFTLDAISGTNPLSARLNQNTTGTVTTYRSNYTDSKVLYAIEDILIPALYYGLLLWQGKGRTPGKRLLKIRVVSIVHRHLSLWHSVERALGYGAAFLELGFGFAQYFIHPYRRCVQDRIAETIVVTEAGYQAMQHKLSHPLIPDGLH